MHGTHIPAVDTGAYPLRADNRIRPLIGGEHAFRRICEAVEAARERVWVTVAFLDTELELPDGRAHLFDVLDAAAKRDVDVRALIWRCPEALEYGETAIFQGTEEDHRMLERRGARFHARWDRLDKLYCQHQKSWIVDAGLPEEVAFVGGINLGPTSVTAHPFPQREIGHTQDIYCELQGPVATDVHHNFVQRWNGASERGEDLGAWPSPKDVADLEFPHRESAPAGTTVAQITRTVRRGFYQDDTPTPGGRPFPVAEGEHSVFDQYVVALDAAREAIYLENQGFLSGDVTEAVARALDRGVEVVVIVPGILPPLFQAIRQRLSEALIDRIVALGERPNFTLASLAANRGDGAHENVYVHTKAAVVDDAWATIGSTNIINRSFYGDTEMNISFWGRDAARFRAEVLSLHHGDSVDELGPGDALRAFRERALENTARKERGEPLAGFAYALDAAKLLGAGA